MPSTVDAQVRTLERFVMPGPVSLAHAEHEADCGKCHVLFDRHKQSELCVDCHKEIAADLASGTGFHSRAPGAAGGECSDCHTEHKGRGAKIVSLDAAAFDHGITDFKLLGKHAAVACADCHATAKPYHAAKTDCYSCHQSDDRHRGNLGTTCADCHTESGWKQTHFDHEKATGYALTGKHAAVATCAGCHAEERYENTPKDCIGCHRADDQHHGTNGSQCQDCHVTRSWKETTFDHFAKTGFALRNGHSGLQCESCHEGNKLTVKPPTTCIGCHAADDSHMGRNGTKCADCHQVTTWKDVKFDHARDAHFSLNGAHATIQCNACHLQPVHEVAPPKDCFGCHGDDDPHAGQLGTTCTTCHGEIAWKQNVRFDHALSSFPLLGKHREAACADCHVTQHYLDAKETCVDCHRTDDVHAARFGTDCAMCHHPNDWLLWTFDHAAQTHFALDGAHRSLDCHACHRDAVKTTADIRLSTQCGSCHRQDDVHRGEFGQQCSRCHTTTSFAELKVLR